MNDARQALSFKLHGSWSKSNPREAAAWVCDTACREIDAAMDHGPVWEKIQTAPYDRDLQLAVVEGDRVYPLVFACRRTTSGWIKVSTTERVAISPTHWRVWQRKD
jgi:hypothetical protein